MSQIGSLRPSQLVLTFGIGSLIDLPNFSGIVMGLDDWDVRHCTEISEDRLLAAVRRRLGQQVEKLMLPPLGDAEERQAADAPAAGVPVAPFPRWFRCPVCHSLMTVDSGAFQLVPNKWQPDRTKYIHAGCGQGPTAIPVRFLIACRDGHITDFPWVEYVHQGRPICKPSRLNMREYGVSGDVSDIVIKCVECNAERRMGDAFDREQGIFTCPGHHPHLRTTASATCSVEARTILLGASNSWFPILASALSLPSSAGGLEMVVDQFWPQLKDIPTFDVLQFVAAPIRMPSLAGYDLKAVWAEIQRRRASAGQPAAVPADLKIAEWEVFTARDLVSQAPDFKLRRVAAPSGFESVFEPTVLVERLREVRALLGFTRIESTGDFTDIANATDTRLTLLSRNPSTWLPASEVRGEGLFIRLREGPLQQWETSDVAREIETQFLESHRAWRSRRRQNPPEDAFPGVRYILLHSLSHAFMRQIALECGYTAASLRERLYCKRPSEENGPMAGILIYTSASDSEGTLGGLVSLGEPATLSRHLEQALESIRICASDPLCSEKMPETTGRGIHASACHACLFAPETSCEKGNRYLDRKVLVQTFNPMQVEYFKNHG